MKLSSDTLGGDLIHCHSTLRDEGVGESLRMDWWFDCEMAQSGKTKSKKQNSIAREVKEQNGITREDLAALEKRLANRPTVMEASTKQQWIIGGVLCIATALATWGITWWALGRTHSEEDQKRDISLEVGKQLGPIEAELSRQLSAQNDKISRIQGALGVAQNSKTTGSLQKFASMKAAELRKNLPALAETVRTAQESKTSLSLDTILAIQKTLAQLNLDNPASAQAAEAIINYASHLREISNLVPNAALARAVNCRVPFSAPGVIYDQVIITGCTVDLDGRAYVGALFENCIVRYKGGALNLRNVTFSNCLYVISLPNTPSDPAKRMVKSILSASSEKPSVTVNSG